VGPRSVEAASAPSAAPCTPATPASVSTLEEAADAAFARRMRKAPSDTKKASEPLSYTGRSAGSLKRAAAAAPSAWPASAKLPQARDSLKAHAPVPPGLFTSSQPTL